MRSHERLEQWRRDDKEDEDGREETVGMARIKGREGRSLTPFLTAAKFQSMPVVLIGPLSQKQITIDQ